MERWAKYEILGVIGPERNAVYRAFDTVAGRQVLLRLWKSHADAESAATSSGLVKLLKQVQVAQSINHPRVAKTYEAVAEAGVMAVVSELVDGYTLREALSEGGLTESKALALAAQIAQGLAAAGSVGAVHQCLKQENIVVTSSGDAKIINFGWLPTALLAPRARAGNVAAEDAQTEDLSDYECLSPEEAQGQPIDARSNVFSFGSILYEMLTGRHPYMRSTIPDTITAILRERHAPMDLAISYDLRAIVERCLAKQPANRFSPTDALVAAFDDLRTRQGPANRFTPRPGSLISHYRILRQIGSGGVATVFEAEDLHLKRRVALKFLRSDLTSEMARRHNEIEEARAAAALNHPNICTIYEVDEAAGERFISMALVEGITLHQRIADGILFPDLACDIAIQICEGLSEAHRKGIVHRDIKSSNIMLAANNQVCITDFGLADLRKGQEKFKSDSLVGTVGYMAPEQIRGEIVDARCDLWAVGVVMYEMLTGVLPFRGETPMAVIYATMNDPPQEPPSFEVPPQLMQIIHKSLEKPVDDRYQTAAEIREDLRVFRTRSRCVAQSTLGIVEGSAIPSIAVLPFADLSAAQDQDYFCQGIAEELINALARVDGLAVVSRSASFQFRGNKHDIREVGNRLNARAVLEGSVRRAGTRLRITAQLIDVASGYHLWSERFDRAVQEIFEIQDEIANSIVSALKIKLIGAQPEIRRHTTSVLAYQTYLQGRYFWNKRVPNAVRLAVDLFQQARAIDPDYALAYAGLADCMIVPGYYGISRPDDVMPQAKVAALRALQLDPQLSEAHTTLAMITTWHEFRWRDAEDEFRKAIECNPKYAVARMWYGLFALLPLGRMEEALVECEKAQQLEPMNASTLTTTALTLFFMKRYEEAFVWTRRALGLDPDFPVALYCLGRLQAAQGRLESAIETLNSINQIMGFSGLATGTLAYVQAALGKTDAAKTTLIGLGAAARQRYVPASALAIAHLGVDNRDEAVTYLEQAIEEHSSIFAWFSDPIFKPLSGSPRYRALIQKLRAINSLTKVPA